MKGAFWILAAGAILSALMAASLTRAADFSEPAEMEVDGASVAEDMR